MEATGDSDKGKHGGVGATKGHVEWVAEEGDMKKW